jgi:hypothetical protein
MLKNPKYAVFYDETMTIPGDERSQTHPGHGYPEHTVTKHVVEEFKTQDEFRTWVEREEARAYGKKQYTAYQCYPIKITTSIKMIVDYG